MLFLSACQADFEEEHRRESPAGPIVVVILGSLPAGVIGAFGGEPGLTPNLDELAAQSWSARAVATSSSPVPSMASLLTGVDPWISQVTSHRAEGLRSDVAPLPQLLAAKGWSTRVFLPLGQRFQEYGLFDGSSLVEDLGDGKRLERELEEVGGRTLILVHLPNPGFPWRDRSGSMPRLGAIRGDLNRIEARWLMPFADPQQDIPIPLLVSTREIFRQEVAWADLRFGELLGALRRNPAWSQLTLVVTALHGIELGESHQVLFAQNLERPTIEVPLLIKWQASQSLPVPDRQFVSLTRLAATVMELAGLDPPPALAPSLFRPQRDAMSVLYDHDGLNRLSLLRSRGQETALQLLWSSRYAEEEPEVWAAQAIEAGLGSQRITGAPREILARLREEFQGTPSLHGRGPGAVQIVLRRWTTNGEAETLEDRREMLNMAADLQRTWLRWTDRERTPREERRYWLPMADGHLGRELCAGC